MTDQALVTVGDDCLPGQMHPEFEHSRDAVIAVVAMMVQCWRRQALELEAFADDYVRIIAGKFPHQRPQLTAEDILAVYQDLIDAWTGHNFPKPAHFQPFVKEKVREKQRAGGQDEALNRATAQAAYLGRRWREVSDVYKQFPGDRRYYSGVKWWDGNKPILDRNGRPMIMDHWGIAETRKAEFHAALADLPVAAAIAVERSVDKMTNEKPAIRAAKQPAGALEAPQARLPRVSGGAGQRGLPVAPSARFVENAPKVTETEPSKE